MDLPVFLFEDDREEVVDGALFDDERTIHVRFAEFQLGIAQHGPFGRLVRETDTHRLAAAVTENVRSAGSVDNVKIARFDDLVEAVAKQAAHGPRPT